VSIIGDIWDVVTGVFSDVAGWAIDAVIGTITAWVIGGVLALIEALWTAMDTTARPVPSAEWFSSGAESPFVMGVQIGVTLLSVLLLAAVIRAILAGSPGGVVRTITYDLPMVVFVMAITVAVTQASIDITDSMSDWIWQSTRPQAAQAMENMALVMRTGLPGTHFAGVVLSLVVLLAMFVLWAVLIVRASLIYIVLAGAAAFAWPAMIFPPFRETAKKAAELLFAVVICKPIITLALSVGISGMAGVGSTGEPGGPVAGNLFVELGTLLAGVVTFGLAAFMPYLVWKLMPLATAALVAQGVASGPMRAAQTGMQLQYYTSSTMNRLAAGGSRHTAAARAAGPGPVGVGGGGAGGTAGAASGATDAAGGPAGAAVSVALATGRMAASTAGRTVDGFTDGPSRGAST
jgi:hypothetical protein